MSPRTKRFVSWVIADPTGASRADEVTRGFYVAGAWLYLFAAVAHAGFTGVYAITGDGWMTAINVISVAAFLSAFAIHRSGQLGAAMALGVTIAVTRAGLCTALLGLRGGFLLELLAAWYFSLMYPWARPRQRVASLATLVVIFFIVTIYGAVTPAIRPLSPVMEVVVSSGNVLLIGFAVGGFIAYSSAVARQSLQASVRSREELLATLGHELRTPVGRIKMALGVLEDEVPADVAWTHKAAVRSANNLGDAVEHVMRYAAFVSGRRELKPSMIPLVELLRQTAPQVSGTLDIDFDTSIFVYADPDVLRPAIANLIRNAFSHGASQAIMRTHPLDDGGQAVSVEDDGPGIPPEHRDDVFRPMVRFGASGGMGLGLSVVARAVRAHGARVIIDTSPQLGGARFTILLPPRPPKS